jgi:hypothetical protein
MGFDLAFHAAAQFASPPDLEKFQRSIPCEWIEAALAATGTATMRRRRLPAEHVIWVVLGIALFRDRSIEDVVSQLDLALPASNGTIAKSSVTQARERLGAEPLRWLFDYAASIWTHRSADAHRWRGLSIFGIDGSCIRLPDTPEIRGRFGGQNARNETESGYPLSRVVVLMALRSHLLLAARFGEFCKSELDYAEELLPELPEESLTILDRGFACPRIMSRFDVSAGRHWLMRAKYNLAAASRVLKKFGKGDNLIEMTVSAVARRKDPSLPTTMQMRAIEYQRKGFAKQTLLTSLCDPLRYPASEIVALYHERWELELSYDELKTVVLDRQETIRSRTPDGVVQELWGILLAYNLIRLEIESIAKEAGVPPTQISFVAALRLMRIEWEWLAITASPGGIPKHLQTLRKSLKRYILPTRRERTYPRSVKLKMSPYTRKRTLLELSK